MVCCWCDLMFLTNFFQPLTHPMDSTNLLCVCFTIFLWSQKKLTTVFEGFKTIFLNNSEQISLDSVLIGLHIVGVREGQRRDFLIPFYASLTLANLSSTVAIFEICQLAPVRFGTIIDQKRKKILGNFRINRDHLTYKEKILGNFRINRDHLNFTWHNLTLFNQ